MPTCLLPPLLSGSEELQLAAEVSALAVGGDVAALQVAVGEHGGGGGAVEGAVVHSRWGHTAPSWGVGGEQTRWDI